MNRIADILLRAQLVDENELRSAVRHQAQWNGRLAAIVVEMRFTTEPEVVDALAKALRLPHVDLDVEPKDPAAFRKVNAGYARAKGVFPYALKDNGKTLCVAMADPTDVPTLDELGLKTRMRILPVLAGEGEIQRAIDELTKGGEVQESGGLELDVADESDFELVGEISNRPVEPAVSAAPAGRPLSVGQLTAEEQRRVAELQDQQLKSTRILRAVLDLCVEKGVVKLDEFRQKIGKV